MRRVSNEAKLRMLVIGFMVLAVCLLMLAVRSGVSERSRLIKQCMDAGHPEYECRSMRFQ